MPLPGPKPGRDRSQGRRSRAPSVGIPRLTAGQGRSGQAEHQPLSAAACRGRTQALTLCAARGAGQAKYPPDSNGPSVQSDGGVQNGISVASAIFWRMHAEVQPGSKCSAWSGEYESGLRDASSTSNPVSTEPGEQEPRRVVRMSPGSWPGILAGLAVGSRPGASV
jgi:hypothetical protein